MFTTAVRLQRIGATRPQVLPSRHFSAVIEPTFRMKFYEKEGDKKKIRETIEENKVVIFSKTSCPYCHKAKDLFRSLGVKFQAVELDTMPDGREIQNLLADVTKQGTVPSIWVNGKFIGGCDDAHALHRSRQLENMVRH
eukprot:TRINITY_DN3186_c0_g1_i1.p1 TRINITY_DN3186_c0_g1~~TRINITY_DN3186_c0_g1_i1.p1  ORF type:complete len:139 (+),score=25.16 TRINITY_DN3186_c0_g1_i1:64-480(+)